MSGPLAPTLVANLFLPLQEELVRVLHGLPAGAWDLPRRRGLRGVVGGRSSLGDVEEAKQRATASGLPALFDPFFDVVAVMR